MSNRIVLSIVILIGLFLRLYGINFGLPFTYHADEPIVVNHAMAYGTGDLNPHFFAIPPLVSYVLFILYGIYFLIGKALHVFSSPESFALAFLKDPTVFYIIGRVSLGVILGTATIVLVYILGKKIFSEKAGLLAALFFSISFINVQNCHYIYADVMMVFFIVLASIAALSIARSGSLKSYITCGIFAGLATAAKYNAALTFIIVPAAYFFTDKERGFKKLVFSFAAMCIAYIVCNPYSLADIKYFVSQMISQAGTECSLGPLYHIRYSLKEGLGLLLTVLGVIGMFYYAVKKRGIHAAIVSFPVLFYVTLIFFSQPHERYVLPLTPFIALYAAALILENIKGFILPFFLVLLIVVPNLEKSIYSDYLFAQQDTRTIAKKWIEENIKDGSKIAIEHSFFCPRLNQTEGQIEEKLSSGSRLDNIRRSRIELAAKIAQSKKPSYYLYYLKDMPSSEAKFLFEAPQVEFSMQKLKEMHVQYVVLHVDAQDSVRKDFYNSLIENATLVREISPYKNKEKQFSDDIIVQTGGPFLGKELFSRERNGYIIKIFRLGKV